MKENVLDVLMYLFENYMDEDQIVNPDRDDLKVELQEAGFAVGEVDRALTWLDGLVALNEHQNLVGVQTQTSVRIYTTKERERLNTECLGFLMFLEQIGVLDPATREKVIDRSMALDEQQVELDQVKWVVLMILFNQPGQEAAFAWMEDLVLDEYIGYMH